MANQAAQGVLSPFLQTQRVAAARPFLRGAVLDIGCGDGALSVYCENNAYFGYDVDPETVSVARANHPDRRFETYLPEAGRLFDTVACLAVIEHLRDPAATLKAWSAYMRPGGNMVLTTPLPVLEWAHQLGAKIGLFSHDAAEEHETLIDRPALESLLAGSALKIEVYRRFLGGANQLFVLSQG